MTERREKKLHRLVRPWSVVVNVNGNRSRINSVTIMNTHCFVVTILKETDTLGP